jgi:hypothetical protein
VAEELEAFLADQVLNVAPRAGEKIVDADDFGAVAKQTVAQMRTEKARAGPSPRCAAGDA